jgi:peptidoglycan/LPS O-acetylase OafA/YrhL
MESIAARMRRLRLSQALVLKLDAVSNGSLALFLLASSWDELFEFFGLPVPEPAFYTQLLGAALIAFAIVEWGLAGRRGEEVVTLSAGVGSGLAAAILVVWLLAGETGADTHGLVALWSVAAFLAIAAAAHGAVLLRRGVP